MDRPPGRGPRRRPGRSGKQVRLRRRSGRAAWQEPDEAAESLGRADLATAIDTEGRRAARSDLASAFGDWESIRERVGELNARAPERLDADVAAALRAAERDPAGCSDAEYIALAAADGPALDALPPLLIRCVKKLLAMM